MAKPYGLGRHAREQRVLRPWAARVRVEVGFLDPHVASLAYLLEYGNLAIKLPARPAFRGAMPAVKALWKVESRKIGREISRVGSSQSSVRQRFEAAAERVRNVIREEYLAYQGPGLSERQQRRKAGSAHATDELIGAEGPKLIERITSRVVD